MSEPPCLEVARRWVEMGVHVVPLTRRLYDNGNGKSAPVPCAPWEWNDRTNPRPEGRLTTRDEVDAFWAKRPEAQLAIVLGDGLAAVDVDLKNLTSGVPPEGFPIPAPFNGGLTERSKSGGMQYLFRHRARLPDGLPARWTGFGTFVDVLAGGLLFTAPSSFVRPDGSPGGTCEVITAGPIPEFDGFSLALEGSAPWLAKEWKLRRDSKHRTITRRRRDVPSTTTDGIRVRMRAGAAGRLAEWICANTDGESRDRTLCMMLAQHVLDVGGNAEQAAEIVRCPSWTPTRISALEEFAPSGVHRLLEFPEGMAAAKALDYAPGKPAPGPFDLTEFGNADRLLASQGDHLRFDVSQAVWLVWDGRRWARDDEGAARRYTEAVLTGIRYEADEAYDAANAMPEGDGKVKALERAGRIMSWWARSSTKARIESCLSIASHREAIPVMPEGLDRDPWLLNVRNGTIDLRTGELHPHSPEDMITRLCPVDYVADAATPLWGAFVRKAMGGNEAVVAFLRRAVGYSLTGSNREQRFVVNWGGGLNGKSTFQNALRSVLGDYAWHAESGTFLRQETPRVRQDLAVLRGVRLVTTSEIEDGKRLDEDLVKRITGGDPVQARHLYSRVETHFVPTLKLWMAVNHKPRITGADDAVWRRVLLVPWTWRVPPDELDKDFGMKLEAEAQGILAWAVAGCREYIGKNGLDPPPVIAEASEEYRAESDILGDFLAEAFNLSTKGKPCVETTVTDVYGAHKEWCVTNHERPLGSKTFSRALKDRGFAQHRTDTTRYWIVELTPAGRELVRAAYRPPREESFRQARF